MGRYFVKQVLDTIPMMFVVSIPISLFLHMIPGDPTRQMAGKEATEQELVQIRQELGLNDPLPNQYINYMDDLFHGDLSTSHKTDLSVSEMLLGRLKSTIQLMFSAIIWSVLLGIAIGVLSAAKRGKVADYVGMFLAISGISIPGFWFGLVLIQIFSVNLGPLPTGGLNSWQSYILPSLTLGCGIMAALARFSRSSILETMREDYVRTARAKGQREWLVVLRYVFRNSLVQMVTVAGLQIGGLLAGSVLVETVFSIPGMGRLLVDSTAFRDYKVVQAELLFFSLEYIVISLIVDFPYGVLNPKIRYQ